MKSEKEVAAEIAFIEREWVDSMEKSIHLNRLSWFRNDDYRKIPCMPARKSFEGSKKYSKDDIIDILWNRLDEVIGVLNERHK